MSVAAPEGALLEATLQYIAHGDPVFPVWWARSGRCACGDAGCESPAKHPIGDLVPSGLHDATIRTEIAERWWGRRPLANIGTPTGLRRSVLDVDPAKGGPATLAQLEATHGALPLTARVLTGGGGEHYHFAPVAGLRNSAGKIGPGLDVRGEGGYVLLAPSNHVSGGVYRDDPDAPLYETPLATMPAWLVALALAPPRENETSNGRRSTDEWAARLAGAPEGQRRAIAAQIAGHYLGLRIAEAEVVSILLGYAARCAPPFPEREVRELVRDLARRDRRKGHAEDASVPNATVAVDGPVLVPLGDIRAESVEWLWRDRAARGKLTLVIGEPGEGKSYMLQDTTARLTRGLPWPDGDPAPAGAVVVLACEDGVADTVRPRIDRQGGDAALVYIFRAVRVEGQICPFNLERDLTALEQALVQTRAIALVVDPISAYLGSRDSYKDAEIRALLDPLAALAERYRVAVLAILHLTKAAQRKILLRAQGSIAFVAAARTVLAVSEDRDVPGRRLLVSVKNNLGRLAAALAFRIDDDGLTWEPGIVEGTAERLLAVDEAMTRADQREREHAVTFLRRLLTDGPASSKTVMADAKANGIAQRTLWRAKSELGIVAERTKGQTGAWYWMLPHREAGS